MTGSFPAVSTVSWPFATGGHSSEMLLKQSYLDRVKELQKLGLSEREAEAESSHEELAVLDKTGRLQLPREYLDVMGIKGRGMLKAEMDGDRIILTKPAEHEQPQMAAESAATDGQG
jgi:hypothetical protein